MIPSARSSPRARSNRIGLGIGGSERSPFTGLRQRDGKIVVGNAVRSRRLVRASHLKDPLHGEQRIATISLMSVTIVRQRGHRLDERERASRSSHIVECDRRLYSAPDLDQRRRRGRGTGIMTTS